MSDYKSDQPNADQPVTVKKVRPNNHISTTLKDQLDENNWADWTNHIIPVLDACDVWEYAIGKIAKPDRNKAISLKNWESNDKFAKLLILQNISKDQLQHINRKGTSAEIWQSITSLHKSTGFLTGLTCMRKMFTMRAADDEDIPEYINKMKGFVEEINAMEDEDLEVTDKMFACILVSSLPKAWDQYVQALKQNKGIGGPLPALNIVHLIQNLKDEYHNCVGRNDDKALHNKTQQSNVSTTKKPLANCISGNGKSNLYCKCCKKRNHSTDDCRHLGKPLCANCGRFGHMTDACYRNGKLKRQRDNNNKNNNDSNPRKKGKYSRVAKSEESAVYRTDRSHRQ